MKMRENKKSDKPSQKPKDLTEFLEGGATDKKEHKEQRKQKIFHLTLGIINALKRRALDDSEDSGQRVTEADIVERALFEYLNI